MSQSFPRIITLLVLGVFQIPPAAAGDEKNKSPEEVFNAFVAAQKKEDVKTSMSHLTRDSQSAVAGSTWFSAVLDKGFFGIMNDNITPKQKKEHAAAIDKVLNRHVVSNEAMRKTLNKDMSEPSRIQEMFVPIGELINDKAAFVEDVFEVTDERDKKGFAGFMRIDQAKLGEVKTDGQHAKGQATIQETDTITIYFKLESGVWKIDLKETQENLPQPQPPLQTERPMQLQGSPTYSRPGLLRRMLDRLFNR